MEQVLALNALRNEQRLPMVGLMKGRIRTRVRDGEARSFSGGWPEGVR